MVLAAVALRGYVPGAEPVAEPQRSASSPAALVVVIAMVTAAVAVIGYAIIARLRDRTPKPPAVAAPLRRADSMGRPSWRNTLIALAVLIGWLMLIVVLSRLAGGHDFTEPVTPGGPPVSDTVTPAPPGAAPPPAEPDDVGTDVIGYLIPPMLVLMVLVVIGSVVASRRQWRHPAPQAVVDVGAAPAPAPASDSLARAAEVGLAEIADLTREPREAIIACYAAMEHELTRVPGAMPQDFDTPSEVLARAVEHRALKADSATELVDLFEEARFSPHVMTEAHRDAAVAVLQRVQREIPSGADA
jgi:hypothetical protein